ncbi:hypothetical protein K445DRAFT_276309 [Daldinia sp. EC12]|nr:hypothetical protein K445DRAFT_276309 [Daldinia sp. EC12]
MPCYFGRVCIESFGSSRKFLFQSPLWLSQRSWELHSNKAFGAWQWNLKSYRVVPSNSKVIKLTQRGSPMDVQKLFDAGLASPYDRDERGWTLLHHAVALSHFEMTKYLMGIGVSPREPDRMRWYPAQLIDSNHDDASQTLDFLKQVVSDTSLAKKLLVYPNQNTDDENKETQLLSCNCAEGYLHPELYMALLPYQCPFHQSTSLPSRLRQAEYFLENIGNINSVKAVLEPDWSANRKAIFCDLMYPMIHPIAYALMQITRIKVIRWNTDDRRYIVEKQNNYFAFAVEVIKLTPDIHIRHPVLSLGKHGWETTALQYAVHTAVFSSCSVYYYFYFHLKPFNLMIMEWLKALALAGVDLEAYGQREYAILLDDYSLRYIVACSHSHSDILRLKIYLIHFKFGPKPEDWEFYFNEPTDEFAGDFWKLVKDPPLRIPGAWVEDDGY